MGGTGHAAARGAAALGGLRRFGGPAVLIPVIIVAENRLFFLSTKITDRPSRRYSRRYPRVLMRAEPRPGTNTRRPIVIHGSASSRPVPPLRCARRVVFRHYFSRPGRGLVERMSVWRAANPSLVAAQFQKHGHVVHARRFAAPCGRMRGPRWREL